MLETFYCIAPDITIIKQDNGNVLFKSDSISIRLEGNSVKSMVEDIFPLLNGQNSLDFVIKKSKYSKADLLSYLNKFVELRILKCKSKPFTLHNSCFDNYLELFNSNNDVNNLILKTKIGILGLEGEGVPLLTLLINSGFTNIALSDPNLVEPNDLQLNTCYNSSSIGKPREEIIELFYDKKITNFNKLHSKETIYEFVENTDLTIICFGKEMQQIKYWANQASIKFNKPVLFSEINQTSSIVGPLVIPNETACFMCYKMREIALHDDFEEGFSFEKFLNRNGSPSLSKKPFQIAAVQYNASLIFNELVKFLFSFGLPSINSQVIEYDFLDSKYSNHYILHRADCPVCGKKKNPRLHLNKAQLLFDNHFQSNLLDLKNLFISSKTGIFKNFSLFQKDATEPSKPLIYGVVLSNHRFSKNEDEANESCSGKGLSIELAEVSALGEAIERFSGTYYSNEEISYDTFKNLGQSKLNPNRLVLFHEDQYSNVDFSKFDINTELGWVNGFSLLTETFIKVPASSIFMNYVIKNKDEYLFPITSNGLAAGKSLLNAILSASLEIIERDAFIISWHNKLKLLRLDPFSHPDKGVREFCESYRRRGVELNLFRLPSDFPCSIFLAIGVDNTGNGPWSVVGLGASFCDISASMGALLEVGQVRPALKQRIRTDEAKKRLVELLNDYKLVDKLEDHDLLFSSSEVAGQLDFMLKQPIEKNYQWKSESFTEEEKLDKLICHLKKIGGDLIYYNLTPTELSNLGLYTVRVLIPDLQPIHFGYNNIRLGSKRIFEMPYKLGLIKEKFSAKSINLYPHPLA